MTDLTEDDFLNAMEQTKLNQHDIIIILNQKQQILTALEKSKKWDDHIALQTDPRFTIITMSYEEIKQLKQLKQRVEERIKFLYKYDDIQCHEEAEKLQKLIKGDSTS